MTDNAQTRPTLKGKVELIKEPWTNPAGTFTKREAVVDTGTIRPNPILVTFKNNAVSRLDGVAVGDIVEIPFAIDGRRWDSPDGAARFFVDIVGLGLSVTHANAAAATYETAYKAWTDAHGTQDKAGFVELCKATKPGKAGKDYNAADWADVTQAITGSAAATPDAAEDLDDLPF